VGKNLIQSRESDAEFANIPLPDPWNYSEDPGLTFEDLDDPLQWTTCSQDELSDDELSSQADSSWDESSQYPSIRNR